MIKKIIIKQRWSVSLLTKHVENERHMENFLPTHS